MFKYFLAAGVAAGFSMAAVASPVIDQSNLATAPVGGQVIADPVGLHIPIPPPPPPAQQQFVDISRAQSVTAGMSGTLVGVDLQLTNFNAQNASANAVFILATNVQFASDGSIISGNVLDTFGFAVSALTPLPTGGLIHFDTSALDLQLNAGDQFWLALEDDGHPSYFGWVSGTSPTSPASTLNFLNYAGGEGYGAPIIEGSGADVKYGDTGHDYGFRTWMDAGAVPEPASWAMMIVGFAMIGGMARRRATGTAVRFA